MHFPRAEYNGSNEFRYSLAFKGGVNHGLASVALCSVRFELGASDLSRVSDSLARVPKLSGQTESARGYTPFTGT